MEKDDVQLIRKILLGDKEAFSALVQKYQNGVHALAWRKVKDFHFAEEITQDVFLQVYKSLPSLKDPQQFVGWLYVITDRLCIDWLRKRKLKTQSLEHTPIEDIEESSYTHYVSEQRETETTEDRAELVKELLEKLPESERTVVTLYYLGEMKTKEIGKFLGVSVNTITSRLQRARKRLQEDQEFMIQEVLGGVQIPASLSQNIMRHVADMKPTPPLTAKPSLPWKALGVAAALSLLLLGVSDRYLVRFQKPYSFKAPSEPTIEIIDAPVVLNIDSTPDARNQPGRTGATGKAGDADLQTSEASLISDTQGDSLILPKTQRPQARGPQGSPVFDIFATAEGTLYATTPTGIHRLPVNTTEEWTLLNTNVPTDRPQMSMVEHGSTLYIVSKDKIFASTDNGETWNTFCPRPEGHTIGLIITDAPQATNSRTSITMYLALQDKGVFRSTDAGAQWHPLNGGLAGKRIYTIAVIQNTVFVGTSDGLYRLNTGIWERVLVDPLKVD